MNRLILLLLILLPLTAQASQWRCFPFSSQYRRVVCAGDDVFLLQGNRLIQADARQWRYEQEMDRLSGLSETAIADMSYSYDTHKLAIVYSDGMIDILHTDDGTFSGLTDLKEAPFEGQSKRINHISEGEGMLCISTDFGFLVVDLEQELIRDCLTLGQVVTCTWIADEHYFYHTQEGKTFTCRITANLFNPNNWSESSATPPTPVLPAGAIDQCASVTGDTLYTLYPDQGLLSSVHSDALAVEQYQQGTSNNRLHFRHGMLSTCHVSDLSNSGYVENMKMDGYLSEYRPDQDLWFNMDHTGIASALSERKIFRGLSDMVPDPFTPHRYYYSTLENGIYVIQDGQLECRWDNFDTSVAVGAFTGNSARVGGMVCSPEGDLWYINEGLDEPLRVRTRDGQWHKFAVEGCAGQTNMPHLVHTRHGSPTLWGCRTYGYEKCIVFAYDYAGTIDDATDDRSTYFMKLTDQRGRTIHPYTYHNVVEAPNGAIWLLSSHGIFVIDQPEQVFERPGQVRTVFEELKAYDIVFDNEQRMWIGTFSDGLYLYDPSATQQLQHFTTDNCILPSNEILALTFDADSNTLWVSCTGHILSYQYDEFEYGTGTSGQAYCHPNLLHAGSQEVVNVLGLADHSAVSVRNSQGHEVCQTTAIGATATLPATQFAPGTYTIIGTDSQHTFGIIGTFQVE